MFSLPQTRNWLLSILLIGLFAFAAIGQDRSPGDKAVRDINIVNGSALTCLNTLSRQFGRPIGFVRALDSPKEIFFTVKMNSATIEDALNSMSRQDSRYKWESAGGVVHFWPATGMDVILSKLLNLSIPRFKLQKDRYRSRLRALIYDLPQVAEFFSTNGLVPDRLEVSQFFGAKYKESNIDLIEPKVFEIFDQIVIKGSSKLWILERDEDFNQLITLNFT